MKTKNRRVSKNIQDARNITGRHSSRAAAQMDMAFNNGKDQKERAKEIMTSANRMRNSPISKNFPSTPAMRTPPKKKTPNYSRNQGSVRTAKQGRKG